MAEANKERTIVITVITVNCVVSVLLILATVYLFTQVTHLQEENRNLRNKWQKFEKIHGENTQNERPDPNEESTSNDEGESKHKKCCGLKGKRGRQGIPGVKGEKGDVGRDGRYGAIGLPGHEGKPGKDGGKGEKGDDGICGPCGQNIMANRKGSPLLHLVGDGTQKKINNIEANAVPFWNVKNKVGDIKYSNGRLTINVEGFYYIYSQMTYCGKIERRVGHYMSVNGEEVLKTEITAQDYGTHSIGSIIKLNKGDEITVVPTFTNIEAYCFNKSRANFGAFLIQT